MCSSKGQRLLVNLFAVHSPLWLQPQCRLVRDNPSLPIHTAVKVPIVLITYYLPLNSHKASEHLHEY